MVCHLTRQISRIRRSFGSHGLTPQVCRCKLRYLVLITTLPTPANKVWQCKKLGSHNCVAHTCHHDLNLLFDYLVAVIQALYHQKNGEKNTSLVDISYMRMNGVLRTFYMVPSACVVWSVLCGSIVVSLFFIISRKNSKTSLTKKNKTIFFLIVSPQCRYFRFLILTTYGS